VTALTKEVAMQVLVSRGCGLDVHQATIVACLLVGLPDNKPRQEIRTFSTLTRDLTALRDWLLAAGCTHVAMESTGVYWKPVYNLLEGHCSLIVANARHIKAVPGRKTDVKDAEWIADLLRHGLLRPSYVPKRELRELRDLLRYRHKLVSVQSAERNRLIKLLESANIKLSSVATDVFGVSGRLMIRALSRAEATPTEMAALAKGRLRAKLPELKEALTGRLQEHQRQLLRLQLARIEQCEDDLQRLEARLGEKLEPYLPQLALLDAIPGLGWVAAATVIAEIGPEMRQWPSAGHLASWAGFLSRAEPERGQTTPQSHQSGQSLSAHGTGRSSAGGDAREGLLFPREVLPAQGAARAQAGRHRNRAQAAGGDLPRAGDTDAVPGTRCRIPGSARAGAPQTQSGAAARTPGLSSQSRTEAGVSCQAEVRPAGSLPAAQVCQRTCLGGRVEFCLFALVYRGLFFTAVIIGCGVCEGERAGLGCNVCSMKGDVKKKLLLTWLPASFLPS
jgi:transposase